MRSLHKITAENFLSLRQVSVELGELNVLVGPNAAGKTNLLKVIQFLGDTVRTDLIPAITSHGGFNQLLFRGESPKQARRSNRIRIGIDACVTKYASPNALDEYSLGFWDWRPGRGSNTDTKNSIISRHETFKFKRTQGRGRRISVRGGRVTIHDESKGQQAAEKYIGLGQRSSGLSTLRRLSEEQGASQVDELAELFENFRVFEVDASAARRPSTSPLAETLRPDASNLAAFLAWLKKSHEEIFELLEEDLGRIVPGVTGLRLRPIGGSIEGMEARIKEGALSGSTPLGAASFGTVRALAILAMLHDPNPPQLTCVEEIDHGLHPHALDRIVERMRDAKTRTQLIVVTHSPALVNRLNPDELIVCERANNGESRIPAIDPEDVSEMVSAAELELGELWFSGALGGALD